MNDAAWNRLISQIRDGYVVPVLGPQLLVGPDGRESLQRRVAERLLAMHDCDVDPADLPPFRELDAAVARLRLTDASPEELYGDVDAAIQELSATGDAVLPAPLRQLAEITDFRLFVTLTPDGLLARCLRLRGAVNEIVHSPKLPTSESRDLPADWARRAGEVQLLYLFGKARPAQLFAIHDEDVLEYAHNIMSRGSQVPTGFLGELLDRNLLLIGCNFPDWLSRFFLRLTSKDRLSLKAKREWMVEQQEPESSLSGFLRSYSKGTQIIAQQRPADFVAELYRRWKADQDSRQKDDTETGVGILPRADVPSRALFFISYSRATDQARAEAILEALLSLGLAEGEVWFDRQTIEPGNDFADRILDGIRGCRYFLPLLSAAADQRDEAFVFIEWRKANERFQAMNRDFIVPVIVDAEYEPERYTAEPVRAWGGLDFGHAPEGVPDGRLLAKLKSLVRDARRPRECLTAA
ncbi:TIR domain-containing protein [Aromatoleum toluolicum]|uniref:TIR domain-containing protein n=1 Tax=Aromatoleum toluolicum TaxID=90060 RepID=A0ABX1NNS0_9RHOO|nr:toll/interleukin-1 receptor domain-containing protein [Aromatoleum toluolicum]NMG00796.1 TIR domain-containing protein [Aromatoleum toluolicum]